jgi:ribosome maturation factor RimP
MFHDDCEKREWPPPTLFYYGQGAVQLKEAIQKLIEETAGRLGYQVYEAGVLLKGMNSQITVKLDSLAGISHLDCERFSKELSAGLDDAELLPNYSLEISSPGLNRAVRTADDFMRFTGSPVKVVYQDGDDRKVVKGVIVTATGEAITVSGEQGDVTIRYDAIVSASLDY